MGHARSKRSLKSASKRSAQASGSNGATFEIVNEGAANSLPKLKITDGTNTLVSITDNGKTGDMTVSGTVRQALVQS